MLLVLPVSRADVHLALPLAKQIAALGGVRPHPILLAFSKTVESEQRKSIERVLASVTDRLIVLELVSTDERGWPFSPNAVFSELARHIQLQQGYGQDAWYFFEADNVPVARGWLDMISAEYAVAKMPYMGVRHATIVTYDTGERVQDGHHMVGTGIYPTSFFTSCRLARHVVQHVPFDVFLQWEILPQLHHTELIQHNWSSCNYERLGDGRIVCESVEDRVGIADPLRPNAVVVHGCKDLSLFSLFLEGVPTPPKSPARRDDMGGGYGFDAPRKIQTIGSND